MTDKRVPRQIFFDDNIGHTAAHIVDARDVRTGEPLAFQARLLPPHTHTSWGPSLSLFPVACLSAAPFHMRTAAYPTLSAGPLYMRTAAYPTLSAGPFYRRMAEYSTLSSGPFYMRTAAYPLPAMHPLGRHVFGPTVSATSTWYSLHLAEQCVAAAGPGGAPRVQGGAAERDPGPAVLRARGARLRDGRAARPQPGAAGRGSRERRHPVRPSPGRTFWARVCVLAVPRDRSQAPWNTAAENPGTIFACHQGCTWGWGPLRLCKCSQAAKLRCRERWRSVLLTFSA